MSQSSIAEQAPSDPPRMKGRPEARSFQIDQLMRMARDGQLRLPVFQRPLKWDDNDRLALFDSVDRGYPIGTLLFWKSTTQAASIEWFETRREVPGSSDAFLVVDGQQRIAALASALLDDGTGRRELVFDLGTLKVRWARRGEAASKSAPCVPARVLLDAADLGEWVYERKLDKPHARDAFELGKRVREFSVPAYVVGAEHEDVLRHVFQRMNTTGKALTRSEVFDAMMVSSGKRALDGVRGVIEDLKRLGFGELDGDVVLNSLEAVQHLYIGGEETKKLNSAEAGVALLRTRDALAAAIEFLKTECAIPRIEWMPYTLPITVLARFFDAFRVPSPRSRMLLRRWFWRGSLEGRLTGTSRSLQEHVRDVREGDEAESVSRLLERTGWRFQTPEFLSLSSTSSVRHARGCLELCALASRRPRHLVTGELIPLSGPEEAEPVRVGTVLDEKPGLGDRRTSIANRLLHPAIPGRGPARLVVECTDAGALTSHCISREAHKALLSREFETFLSLRFEELDSFVLEFFDRMAEWDAEDGPALSQLRLGA